MDTNENTTVISDTKAVEAPVKENEVQAVTVDFSQFKSGDYLMFEFKPEAKLKATEGYLTDLLEDPTDEKVKPSLVLTRGKQQRQIDLWKVSEAISVEPPLLKKAKDSLEGIAPDGPLVKGIKHAASPSEGVTLVEVDPNELWFEEGFNPRDVLTNLGELTNSMKANGFLSENPVTVRRVIRNVDGVPVEGLELIGGHRRHAAAMEAGIEKITAFVKDHRGLSDTERLLSAMISNDSVKLNLLERAKAIKRLLDLGLKRQEVAKRLGKPVRFITDHMRLLNAPKEVLETAEKGTIPTRFIVETLRKYPDDPEAQVSRIRKAVRGVEERKQLKIREAKNKSVTREKVKEEKKLAKALLAKTMPRSKAIALLAEVSNAYTAFKRSRRPAKSDNEAWATLEKKLVDVQRHKKRGLLKVL